MPQTTQPRGTDMSSGTPTPVRRPATRDQLAAASGAIPAECLFKGVQEIRILHKGDLYRLRITRNDKLILTK